ncbi:Cdc6/Cdc18 family protein [Haloarcula sp. JP-L23]|uniref:Cdc6/Cdc18 family protein n=1 Tax=Haloarcula sp. JP-L23 TaxID=2716717 RepID=UPI001D041825
MFEDEHVLQDEYTPEKLIERDEEKDDYVEALQPVANGGTPRNIFVYGDTGVGKTVATRMILDELVTDTDEFEDVDVEIVWLNCKGLTSYQTAVQLVNSLRGSSRKISSSGHAKAAVYEMLWSELDDRDATHVLFVLDEVDSLGSDDNLLYQIPRARSNQHIEDTHIGLIGICNNFKFRESLSQRVKSTLCETEIRFGPYDAGELRTILNQRADKAFVDGVLDDDVIPLAAALAGQNTGSARRALDILYNAGSLARKHDDDTVTEDHVREAVSVVEKGVIEDELRDLPTQSHLVLYAIAQLEQQGETPARRKEIYEVYEGIAERGEFDVKAQRTVLDRLGQLSLKGFLHVNEVNKGRGGGKHHQYELDVKLDLVLTVLDEHSRIVEATGNQQLSDFT